MAAVAAQLVSASAVLGGELHCSLESDKRSEAPDLFDGPVIIFYDGEEAGAAKVADKFVMSSIGDPVATRIYDQNSKLRLSWTVYVGLPEKMKITMWIRKSDLSAQVVGTFGSYENRLRGRGQCVRR
ncbi:MAG: hypothetical protein ACU0DK_14460 [Pseudooceanicola sp.]